MMGVSLCACGHRFPPHLRVSSRSRDVMYFVRDSNQPLLICLCQKHPGRYSTSPEIFDDDITTTNLK